MFELESKTIQNSDGAAYQLLIVSGDLGIATIGQLKNDLLSALQSHDHVILDMAAVTDVDYSVLQLLCSANKYAQKYGKHFQIKGQCTEAFIDRAQSLGFFRDQACNEAEDPMKCLWIPENLT
ncbi:STAS domain-containing protein [Desulfuromonas acetoxidans]|uniref:Anti-sigma-factor antagonist n=1 Tax=Desulfuromonas acetoxidans (strain DSM 684 / 11070) TaxID=281689 RepID=Q1JXR2_DESA6|nr:STAS domain-containing protein [Desulfuromonas acetoxidans]EAT15081.1 anti-sigma-factor antagonist [Desulfuromonas acetoxidans DSM 684]EAT15429.1 anti-sigma-factor antagonist [Desulfuromonas acetoxidans DSM 684]MBF0647183.1 STAS domain-containing protein [Desulfuromonas acetoxidans]NVD26264.1 STAS domain-containing protein [Desulfuromonas acetoxidans]NVE18105.1 STAS domain-containing protein [Desulfuromonas acetoxidans]